MRVRFPLQVLEGDTVSQLSPFLYQNTLSSWFNTEKSPVKMKIIPLKDGDFSVTKHKEFSLLSESNDPSGLKMAVQPFLIVLENEIVLLDAGLGWLEKGEPKIIRNMERAGYAPSDVSKILLSHLHKDHIDGLVNKHEPDFPLNFPNAEVYIQKREYEYAFTQEDNPSFDLDILDNIVEKARIVLMDEDKGNITDEISFEVSGGHTPFHQVFWIKEGDEMTFYGADNLPTAGYLKLHIAYKSDYDGKKAMQERQKWERQAKKENWNILLYHDIYTPVLNL